MTLLFAQAGIGDVPSWVLLFGLCIWPHHIAIASGVTDSSWTLVGYCPAAVVFQATMLILLLASSGFIFRSSKIPVWVKVAYLPVTYPIITFATNIVPTLFRN